MSMLGRMFGLGRNEHYDKGIRLFDQGLFAEAVAELNLAARQNPDEMTERLASFYLAESHASLGTAALDTENYPAARTAFAAALAINPHYADLHFQAGRAARADADNSAALAAFDAALTVNPRYAKALFYRGLSLYALDRPAEALTSVQSAVAADGAFAVSPYEEAAAAHDCGDYSTAMALLARIAETDIDDITFHSRLGADLYRRGMYAESVAEFEKALALNSNYADLHNSHAIALTALERYADAIAAFHRALSLNPKYADARTNLALTLRAAGLHKEAASEFTRVLEDDPTNTVAQDGLGH